MSQELKPCPTPWCAKITASLLVHRYPKGWVVQCLDCGVKSLPFRDERKQAIAAWNARSDAHLLRSNERLVGTLKHILDRLPDADTIEQLVADVGLGYRRYSVSFTDKEITEFRAALTEAAAMEPQKEQP